LKTTFWRGGEGGSGLKDQPTNLDRGFLNPGTISRNILLQLLVLLCIVHAENVMLNYLAGLLQHLHLTTMDNNGRQQPAEQLVQKPAGKPVDIQRIIGLGYCRRIDTKTGNFTVSQQTNCTKNINRPKTEYC